jgi:flagellar motility protein MotE (MotC chaperone)
MADNKAPAPAAAAAPAGGAKPAAKGAAPPAAAGKTPAAGAGTQGAAAKSGEEKHVLRTVLLIAIPILLVAAFITEEIIFNYLGTRTIMRDLFIRAAVALDPDFETIEDSFERRDNELNAKKEWLDGREASNTSLEQELSDREATISSIEDALDKRKQDLDDYAQQLKDKEQSMLPIFRRDYTAEELADFQSLSDTYANMDAPAAAAILAELYDPEGAAMIIYHMDQTPAAAILSAMDPPHAARITEILLGEPPRSTDPTPPVTTPTPPPSVPDDTSSHSSVDPATPSSGT